MIWRHLYCKSSSDHGKKSVCASVELLEAIIKGHWLSFACFWPENIGLDDMTDCTKYSNRHCQWEECLRMRTCRKGCWQGLIIIDSALFSCDDKQEKGTVYNYSRHSLRLLPAQFTITPGTVTMVNSSQAFRMLWLNMKGERVMRCLLVVVAAPLHVAENEANTR